MQVDNRFLDDLARVANGAVGALSGIREEVEAMVEEVPMEVMVATQAAFSFAPTTSCC